jgi:mono/diheme cytochrome c family protein
MSDRPYRRATSRVHWLRLTPLLAVLALAAGPARAQDDFAGGRRIFLEKADCAYCHGWAGDGAGQGQSPGAAANLRQSKLDRDSLIMVISCGIPGKAMPHFDDQAYTDKRCYGMTEAEMGDKVPPFPPSTTLPRRDIELVADYLRAKVIGRGAITREECEEKLGPRVRSCAEYPAGP